LALCSGGAASLVLVGNAPATIVYSGQKNIGISRDFEGVFINVTAQQSSTSKNGAWDLNPFFGGAGIANSAGFQPVRSGTGSEDPVVALALGTSVGSAMSFSTGWGGSGAEDNSGHLGPGAGQFTTGQTGYLGFKLLSGTDVNYGWMRVNLTHNGDTGTVLDWAYDNTGSPIPAGAVAGLGAAPTVLPANTIQTLSASQAGTGLLMAEGAKITFNEGTPGGTYAGSIQGAGEIKVSGAGGLRLSGDNTFSGTASVDEGSRLTVGGAGNLGSAQIRIGSAGSLEFDSRAANNGSANTFANAIILDGQAATLNNSGSGKVVLSGPIASNGTLLNFTGGSVDVPGGITGTGSLSKEGTGTLTLSGSNSYDGGTTLSAGSLAINNARALGRGALTIAGGTTIDNTSGAAIALAANNAVNLNGNLTFGGSNDLNLGTGAVTLSANPQFTLNGTSTLTIGGAISGASNLSVTGPGQVVLAGNNSYTGATSITGGATFTVTGNSGLGATDGGTTVGSGSSLVLSNVNYTTAEPLILQGNGPGGTGALANTGTSSFAGPITAATNSTINGGNGTLNLSGGIDKTGTVLTLANGTFNLSGSGITGNSGSPNSDLMVDGATVNLNVASSYYGPTFIVNGGTVHANAAGALPAGGGRTVMALDATGSGGSTLALGGEQAVASLTGGAASMVTLGSQALTIGTAKDSTTFAGVISGAGGSVIKDGASIQVLTNSSTYTGATTVTAGTLEVSGAAGALTATSAVNISGGTLLLGGSATDRISNTAAISLGAATDSKLQLSGAVTESLGAMTLSGGEGKRVIDFGSGSGSLTLASLSADSHLPVQIWNWSGTPGTGGGTDRLFITGGLGGSLAVPDISFYSGSGSGPMGAAKFASGSNGELVPVPEASTLLGVLGLMVPLAWRERRHWMRCRAARG